MRCVLFTAALALSTSATAQTVTPVPSPLSVGTAKFTLDTPIEKIVADPLGKAILEKYFGDFTKNPAYNEAKGMSINEMRQGAGDAGADVFAKVATELAAIK